MDNTDAYITLNVQGFKSQTKRHACYTLLKRHKSIGFLQETWTSEIDEAMIKREWGGTLIASHGTNKSCGVIILIPKDLIIEDIFKDNEGRIIACYVPSLNITLCNVYSPVHSKLNEQHKFYKDFISYTDSMPNLVAGGDTNLVLNTLLDRKSDSKYIKTSSNFLMEEWINKRDIVDIWRVRNPDKKRYTHRQRIRGGKVVHSRLDYWLIDMHLQFIVKSCEILPSSISDHNPVLLKLTKQNETKIGRGLWKFNKSLLYDSEYVEKVKHIINQARANYKNANPSIFLDTLKAELRGMSISHSSYIAKLERAEENILLEEIQLIESLLPENPDLLDNLNTVKTKFKSIHIKQAAGHKVRAREHFIDLDERPSKFFLEQEKSRGKINNPGCLFRTDESLTNDPEEILKLQEDYYKDLYAKKPNDTNIGLKFTNNLKKVTNEAKKKLCEFISMHEISEALLEMANNKSPGSDGFTIDFYKFFWPDLKDIVYNSLKYALESGSLSIEQKRGVINLIPKSGKDLRFLSNWRPISLLNTDYKILAKLLAKRLQPILPDIIDNDQSAYIKGRNISDNVRSIWDLIEYTSLSRKPAYILFIDFEKAFDSLSFEFLINCLEKSNLGKFIDFIKVLYNNVSSCILHQGSQSAYFGILRGVRQGCPLSSLLFIIALESFASTLRNDKGIEGIKIGNITKKYLYMQMICLL